jgi:hypothetical protein
MGQSITSLEGYVRKISEIQPKPDEVLLYRGHSRKEFTLLPSVLRDPKYQEVEHSILRELVASHPADFASDTTTLEQLVRVQHYSLPTRLLDATWNPLVALYFTVRESTDISGEVIVFRIKKDQVKFFDSDTVIKFTLAAGDPFNQQPQIDRLLQFIRVEKPYFKGIIVPDHLKTVLCVKPKHNNQRILAQAGAFLLWGLAPALDSHPISGIAIERIRVNVKQKGKIMNELDRMSVNESTMFPEIERAALYIRKKLW